MAVEIPDNTIIEALNLIKNTMPTKADVNDIKDKLSLEELSVVIGKALKAAERTQH